MKKYNVYKLLILLLGFPVIAGYAVYKSWTLWEYNYSYFPYLLAGIAVLAVLALLYYAAVFITGAAAKRAKSGGGVMLSTVALVVTGALLSTGVWFAADKYVPPILNEATQYTITYDELKEDYEARGIAQAELLTGFIEMNVRNGRLSPEKADLYREEGYGNNAVRELIANSFNSFTYDGYDSFNGMLVSLADGGRLTVPVLIHLLFDERSSPSNGYSNYTGEGRGEENKDAPLSWSILDLQGGAMTFSIDTDGLLPADYGEVVDWLMPALFGESGMAEELLTSVNGAIASDELLGAPIYVSVNYADKTLTVSIESSGGARGVWDYKKMAWLNSNHILIALLSVFPIRNAFYMFGGLLALTGFAVGCVRQKQYARGSERR
ncbi:MAG: hypothetical protein LBP79_06240 [Clostridiales bacterium]|jgi:hypothetical protein|nr:hypothetical protein [Clostridiales bacterium]